MVTHPRENSRRRADAYSTTSVPVQLVMPPTPKPVTMRDTPSTATDSAPTESSMPALISTRHPKIIVRRPNRSASGETTSAPSVMPRRLALSNAPSRSGPKSHSLAIAGAVSDIASTSTPSTKLMAAQIATTVI